MSARIIDGGGEGGGDDDERAVAELVRAARRVAVLGIKTEEQRHLPAFYVPAYLADAGVEIVPVPVYFPDVMEILELAW